MRTPAIPLPAGFNLALRGEQLVFGDDVLIRETKTRTRGELAPVAREPDSCKPADAIQYWMYNDVYTRDDKAICDVSPVQYELTLLAARPLGSERNKTFGHIHNIGYRAQATFPEVFEVIYGTAYFLLYQLAPKKKHPSQCGYVVAHAGEQLIMPSNMFHLTLNAGDTPLLFADLISKRAYGIYDEVRATRGAPYFFTSEAKWIRNPSFVRAIRLKRFTQLKRHAKEPLYTEFVRTPQSFRWLDEPIRARGEPFIK
jgi:glucose-6-phosphate isomerase